MSGWIGVDLDATLAHYDDLVTIDQIGEPIMPMVNRVKAWLAEGHEVRIFTARYSSVGYEDLVTGEKLTEAMIVDPIKAWCLKHIGQELEVTNKKDLGMIVLYDDRAVRVEANTGKIIGGEP